MFKYIDLCNIMNVYSFFLSLLAESFKNHKIIKVDQEQMTKIIKIKVEEQCDAIHVVYDDDADADVNRFVDITNLGAANPIPSIINLDTAPASSSSAHVPKSCTTTTTTNTKTISNNVVMNALFTLAQDNNMNVLISDIVSKENRALQFVKKLFLEIRIENRENTAHPNTVARFLPIWLESQQVKGKARNVDIWTHSLLFTYNCMSVEGQWRKRKNKIHVDGDPKGTTFGEETKSELVRRAVCLLCNKEQDTGNMLTHLKVHHDTSAVIYSCKYCGECITTDKGTRDKHEKKQHLNQIQTPCNMITSHDPLIRCPYLFWSDRVLDHHRINRHPLEFPEHCAAARIPVLCSFCPQKIRGDEMTAHIYRSHEFCVIKCNMGCQQFCANRVALDLHFKKHHEMLDEVHDIADLQKCKNPSPADVETLRARAHSCSV